MMNYGMYPSYYQPLMNAQQRIQQYDQQMMPQVQQPMQQPAQPQTVNYVAIPVANIEEANAYRVDLNGTPTFFYNAGKNEIYLKRTNTQTGAADFFTFAKQEQPKTDEKSEKPILVNYEQDFKALNDKIDGFGTKIDDLYSLLQPTSIEDYTKTNSKGVKNAK